MCGALFFYASPPPPPPPPLLRRGRGARGNDALRAFRSKNGTPGNLRARNLHKTGILFNLRRLKNRGGSPPQFVRASRLRLRTTKSIHTPGKTAILLCLGLCPVAQQNKFFCAFSALHTRHVPGVPFADSKNACSFQSWCFYCITRTCACQMICAVFSAPSAHRPWHRWPSHCRCRG